MVTEVFCFCY